jgi:hypothetical protein
MHSKTALTSFAGHLVAPMLVALLYLVTPTIAHVFADSPRVPVRASELPPETYENPRCGESRVGLVFADCPSCPGTICGIPIAQFNASGQVRTD